MQIRTAGDLRGFLADIMVGIQEGKVSPTQAQAISKVAAQINQSLAVEVNTALQLERMGKDRPVAGSMLLRSDNDEADIRALPPAPPEQPFEIAEDNEDELWVESAVRHIGRFSKVADIDDFVASHCDRLEVLMENRPDLHAKVTVAINEAHERAEPKQLDRMRHKLRDDLEWCDQCDMMVAPEDSAGCKSKYCSLRKTA